MAFSYDAITVKDLPICFNNGLRPALLCWRHDTKSHLASQLNCG